MARAIALQIPEGLREMPRKSSGTRTQAGHARLGIGVGASEHDGRLRTIPS
jgi:hypothetical protein